LMYQHVNGARRDCPRDRSQRDGETGRGFVADGHRARLRRRHQHRIGTVRRELAVVPRVHQIGNGDATGMLPEPAGLAAAAIVVTMDISPFAPIRRLIDICLILNMQIENGRQRRGARTRFTPFQIRGRALPSPRATGSAPKGIRSEPA
jgi:hypothetical protein